QPVCTLMRAVVRDGRLEDVELVSVDRTP
ncbi:YfcE family phosphodiesterase, partial [Streptococcus agalactiae]